MSERKVLNKYFPPDFDPSLIPRRKQPKNSQQVVRLMAPFSMRCNTCGEYIYKGKKFNARKETVENEDYFGIKIFRFYIKCTLCSAEITFKTDPKNTDYASEHGASRNFEPWRDEASSAEVDRLAKLEEEENNPMKVLENRTLDSKREMDVLDALQDIRARNARNERMQAKIDGGEVGEVDVDVRARVGKGELEDEEERERRIAEEEDERMVREVFAKVVAGPPTTAIASSSAAAAVTGASTSTGTTTTTTGEPRLVTVKRKATEVEPDLQSLLPDSAKAIIATAAATATKKRKVDAGGGGVKKNSLGIKLIKKGKAKAIPAS